MYDEIRTQTHEAICELLTTAKNIEAGDVCVVGCSSSEIAGHNIGTFSSTDIADVVFAEIYSVLSSKGIYLAAQCCEHLNRAIIMEKEAAMRYGLETVNVVPQPKAGGSFATAAYREFTNPVALEEIHIAKAGLDIGGTLIGMHLKKVVVPVHLSVKHIGEAVVLAARTRPKFIGGERAHYDDLLK